jgi:hypothetical protein
VTRADFPGGLGGGAVELYSQEPVEHMTGKGPNMSCRHRTRMHGAIEEARVGVLVHGDQWLDQNDSGGHRRDRKTTAHTCTHTQNGAPLAHVPAPRKMCT